MFAEPPPFYIIFTTAFINTTDQTIKEKKVKFLCLKLWLRKKWQTSGMNWKNLKRKNIQNFNCLQDLTVKIIFTTAPVKITKQTMKEKNIQKFRAGREVSEQSPRFLKTKLLHTLTFPLDLGGLLFSNAQICLGSGWQKWLFKYLPYCLNTSGVGLHWKIFTAPGGYHWHSWHFHLQHHKNTIIELNLDIINWKLWINIIHII